MSCTSSNSSLSDKSFNCSKLFFSILRVLSLSFRFSLYLTASVVFLSLSLSSISLSQPFFLPVLSFSQVFVFQFQSFPPLEPFSTSTSVIHTACWFKPFFFFPVFFLAQAKRKLHLTLPLKGTEILLTQAWALSPKMYENMYTYLSMLQDG